MKTINKYICITRNNEVEIHIYGFLQCLLPVFKMLPFTVTDLVIFGLIL